jgi:CDP-diacylglycerol--serine O-phosphatidyltransferase
MGLRSVLAKAPVPRVRSIISRADLLTLTNLVCGFFAIVTIAGDSGEEVFGRYQDHEWAIGLIILGAVADAFDGMVARKYGSSALGGDLDTLADAVTFVIAPSLLLVDGYGAPGEYPVRAAFVACLVTVMGILRLARFNSDAEGDDSLTFDGLPTPICAAGICALVLIDAPALFGLSASAVLALLMMSKISYPKTRYRQRYALAMMAAGVFIVGGIIFIPEKTDFFARSGFAMAAFFIAIVPFLLSRRKRAERKKAQNELDMESE